MAVGDGAECEVKFSWMSLDVGRERLKVEGSLLCPAQDMQDAGAPRVGPGDQFRHRAVSTSIVAVFAGRRALLFSFC